jgi:hypothetical protein
MSRLIGTILVLVSMPLPASAQITDYSEGHGFARSPDGGGPRIGQGLAQAMGVVAKPKVKLASALGGKLHKAHGGHSRPTRL